MSASFHPLCTVVTVTGPLAWDVESLALCLRALLSEHMHRPDPTVPFLPFREEVSWVGSKPGGLPLFSLHSSTTSH